MKSTGVVRKIDNAGRFVVPKEICRLLDIKAQDNLEIFIDGERIVLQKYQPACIFCNEVDDVVYFNGKRVCGTCVEKMKKLL